ncbi:MAG: hypothetical protein JO113_00965 [Candidatus Eremiobacteraeota bacterium]|nr:hypothetical protein [Candidatus Eremiobacteraeota bacterium]
MFVALPVTTVIAQAASPSPAPAAASPAPVPAASAAPAAANDTAVTARAKDWFHQIQTGKVDRSQLDQKMNAALTDSLLANVSAQVGPLGNPSAFTLSKKASQGGISIYVFQMQFPSLTLYEIFALDADGKIAGLRLTPQSP